MEAALALEKLLPRHCQVLGIVAPGIVGERAVLFGSMFVKLAWLPTHPPDALHVFSLAFYSIPL